MFSRIPRPFLFSLACQAIARTPRVIAEIVTGVWVSGGTAYLGAIFSAARWLGVASLPQHVSRVVLRRPEKEMAGIYAGSHIAMVAHKQPGGDGAIVQLPRNPVGAKVRLTSAPGRPYFPVPLSVTVRLPYPALTWAAFFHLRPEPFGERFHRGNIATFAAGVRAK